MWLIAAAVPVALAQAAPAPANGEAAPVAPTHGTVAPAETAAPTAPDAAPTDAGQGDPAAAETSPPLNAHTVRAIAPVPATVAAPTVPPELLSLRTDVASLEALVAGAGQLVDPLAEVDSRVAAVDRVASARDARAIPFLRVATRGPAPLRAATRDALASHRPPGAEALLMEQVHGTFGDPERIAAVTALASLGGDRVGALVESVATDPSLSREVRAHARTQLQTRWPERFASLPAGAVGAHPLGVIGTTVSGALVGGSMLSFVGVLGDTDWGPGLGNASGLLIGGGSAAVYAVANETEADAGMQAAFSTGWGLAGGAWTAAILSDEQALTSGSVPGFTPLISALAPGNMAGPGWRALGTATGGAVGQMRRFSAEPWDLVERNAAGILVSQAALAGQEIFAPVGCSALEYAAYTEPSPAEFDEHYSDGDYEEAWREVDRCQTVLTPAAAAKAQAAGAAVGLALGHALAPRWQLDAHDMVLAGVVGATGMYSGGLMMGALSLSPEEPQGFVRAGGSIGTSVGLAWGELAEERPSAGWAGYGAASGAALGSGLPLLLELDATVAYGGSAGLAIVGAGLGGWSGDRMNVHGTDIAVIGIAVPVAAAHGAVIAANLDDAIDMGGASLTMGGAAAAALYLSSPHWQPEVGTVALSTTFGGWGLWATSLAPPALGVDLDDDRAVLLSMGGMDVGALAGGIAAARGATFRQTVLPQVAGVTGSTLGALGAALFSGDGQHAAIGALAGGAVGIGGGALWTIRHPPKAKTASLHIPLSRRSWDLPGQWSGFVSPAPSADGAMGWSGQLQVVM